jgi:Gpi18-like mannosyltransferase
MQVDSIHSTLLLFAIIFVLLGNPAVCIIFLILALNTKLQSIILLPVIGLLLLKYFRNRKAVFRMVASLIITQAIIILPFLINGTTHLYYRVITGAVDFFPKVSMNAFNMWYWITNSDPMEIDDFNPWMGLTYKLWGLIFFMIAGAIALLPLIAKTVYRLLYKLSFDKQYLEQMFLTSALCIIIFFFFNTQMHERYVHPAIVLLFGYSVLRKNYLLYVICSVAYFLNLECINQYLKIRHVTPYFDARYIAALYLFIIVAATWRLYRRYDLVHDIQLIRSRMFTKYAA